MGTSLTFERVQELAPVVKIHSTEEYHPIDPNVFISKSRFRHHKAYGPDYGYNKKSNEWLKNNSRDPEYYNIPVSYINSFGLFEDGKNCRPRDSNRGPKTYFLETDDNLKGSKNQVLNNIIPAYYRIVATTKVPYDPLGISWYYYKYFKNYKSGDEIIYLKYYFFFGYSRNWESINHQGDWEHISVGILNNKINFVIYFHHGKTTVVYPDKLKFGTLGHYVVYIANGSHGIYPQPGNYPTKWPDVDHCDSGYEWRMWENLKNLNNQPWKNFAGAWGGVGNFEYTTGPLGPYYKKFY